MDIRTHGKDFERYYNRPATSTASASSAHACTRSTPVAETDDLEIRYVAEDGELRRGVRHGRAVGRAWRSPPGWWSWPQRLHIDLTQANSAATSASRRWPPPGTASSSAARSRARRTSPSRSSRLGRARPCAAGEILAAARKTLTKTERSSPRSQRLHERAADRGLRLPLRHQHRRGRGRPVGRASTPKALPNVVLRTDNLFTCSQDTQEKIARSIREHRTSTAWWWPPAPRRPTSRSSRRPWATPG